VTFIVDLPPALAECLNRCCDEDGRRFFVAWHPDVPNGVLRHKSPPGVWGAGSGSTLADWRVCSWGFRGHVPTITDVTVAIPGLWRTILAMPVPWGWGLDRRLVFLPPDALDIVPVGGMPVAAVDLTESASIPELAGALPGELMWGNVSVPQWWQLLHAEWQQWQRRRSE